MNKSYRTVWNATTGTWAAAPETARMRTKSKANSTMRSSVTAAVAVMAGVGGGTMSVDAMAQATGGGLNLCSNTTAANGVRYGQTFGALSNTTSANCAPINTSLPTYQGHAPSFVLGNNAGTNGATGSTPTASVMGATDGHLVLYGQNGVHISGPADFNNNVNMTNHRITGLAAGTAGTDAVNLNQLNSAIAGAATASNPYVAISTGTYAAATAARAGSSATAIGANASATGTSAVALGGNTVASAQNATAIGTLSRATGAESAAVGTSANAAGANASAFGQAAGAQAVNTTAMGSRSAATADGATALGYSASAVGANAIAVGRQASTSGTYGTAIGYQAKGATNAVGVGVLADASGNASVALGNRATSTGANGIAIGSSATAGNTNTVAIGAVARAAGEAGTAVGIGAAAAGYHSAAFGANANAGHSESVAIGVNSATDRANSVSVGSASLQRQITNLAAGTANTDAVNLGQMNTALSTKVDNTYIKIATAAGPATVGGNGVAIGGAASATGASSLAVGNGSSATVQSSVAVGNGSAATGGNNATAVGAGTSATTAWATAFGSAAIASANSAIAVGAQANASGVGAVTVGNTSNATGDRAVAMGSRSTASGDFSVALGAQSIADRDNSVSVGSTTRQRQVVNLAAGTQATDAVNVSQLTGVTKALGGGAAVDANGSITNPTYNVGGTDYHNVGDALDALASSGIGNPNAVIYDDATKSTVTLGGTGAAAPVALKNVADAKDDHDALNLGQLKNAGLVGDDGAGNLTSLAVTYDDATKDTATLAGASGTTLSNVKAGVADMDAVNVSQLKGSGLIGDDGKSIAAVTYDRNADGTPNYGTVTLGNGAGPTQVKNVADATDDHDALNLGQLKDTGLVGDDGSGNLTSLAVTYDDATKTAVTLGDGATPVAIHNVADGVLAADSKDAVNGSQLFATNTRVGDLEDSLGKGGVIDPVTGESLAVVYDSNTKDTVTLAGASGTTLSNVKAGVADMDAVNVSQLKGSGLIGDDGKSIAAVTYDRNADGTPNYGSVTLGNGAGPTQVKNVADATDDHDALNLGQLKDTGLVGDDGAGNLTSLAVTYDGAAKDSVTLGGMGATAPVAIHNVADGVLAADSKDAVNGSQLFATNTRVGDLEDSLGKGGVIDPVTGESLAVVYDSNVKDTVTLAGTTGTTLSNVKAGVADMDAVNVSQLKGSGLIGDDGKSIAAVTYDRNPDGTPNYGSVTLGNGAGPTQVKNVADATDDHDALNLGQLKDAGLVGDDGAGNLTSMAVTYDGSARDKVTLAGVDGTTLSNVKAGVADMDAVNVSQLKGSGLIGDDGKSIAAVTYDRNADGTPNYGTVTLGNGAGPTQVKNVADATDDHDALNLGQLKDAGLVGDDGAGNLTSLAVTYDGTTKDSVTLGGVGATAPVALHNVADGVLSATSKDAVNGSQLFATNTRVGDLEDSLGKGGVIDPVTGESLAVVYDSNVKDTVTLAGTNGTTLSNVKAGVADMDAVNVSQLKDSGLIDPSTGKAIAAVTYDRNADGTPNYGTVTLGNGAGPTQIKNVATGVDDLDAVNVKQLNTGLSDLEDRMSGGNLRFVKVNADPLTGTPAVASGALAVAIGSDARATSANSLALGSGARVTGAGSVAIGYNSVANQNNVVSVGDVGRERKVVNVADGDVAFQSTDAVNGGQLYAALNTLSTSVTSKTQQAIDTFSSEIDKKTKAAIDEVSARSMQPMDVSDPLVAIEGLQGNNVASLNGADPTKATAAAIGSSTAASGANAVAVGLQSGAGSNNSVAIGSFAQTGAGQDYSVAVGSNVQTNGTQAVALGANAQANGEYALAVGNNGAQAIGDGSIAVGNAANVRAGATNAVAIGTGANVARSVEGAMALGANATAGAANSIALGANAFSDRANALSVGRAGAERQIVNVAAGTQTTDAVNVGQLKGVTDSLGGGSTVGADGKVTNPTYSLADPADASKSVAYDNVGDALSNLDGRTATNTQNITVINKQLADSGLVDPVTGQSIAAVTYDRNPDGTPNYGSVTLGNGTGPTQLKNVADATDDGDALNLGQLKDAGLVGDDGSGNLTSMAVTYDGTAKDSVTLGGAGATTPVALHNVADGVLAADSKDAVNGSQLFATNQNLGDLKDSLEKGGVIDPTTGESLAVVYDSAAKNSVTLGNAGVPVAIHNVAAGAVNATSHDAVNGSQLFTVSQSVADKIGGGAGVGADGSLTDPTYSVGGQDYHNVGDALGALDKNSGGNPLAVAYDSAAKDTVTLGGAGATTPVALKNVADAKDDGDALNLGQLKNAGLVGDDGAGNLTSMAVTYDGAARDKVTLAGVDGTTLSNVKAGVADMDAVNVSQLKDAGLIDPSTGKPIAAVTYDSAAKDSVTLGGAGATTPVALKNVADAKDDGDALNLGQLKNAGLVGDDGAGNLTSMAVTYDGAAKDTVTLGGTGATAPVALKNVADGTDRHDAINVGQLQDAGLVAPVDPSNPGAGLTSLAVAYDGVAKDVVTLKGTDGTTLSNVKAGVADMDAVNVSQLKDAGLIDPSTGKPIAAVTYDSAAKDSVTLGGAGATTPVALKNVADATDDGDALNLGQLKNAGLVGEDGSGKLTSMAVTYDSAAKDAVTLGGAGATTPVALKNVADGTDRNDAINLGQLQDAGLVAPVDPTNPGKGLTSLAVAYDSATQDVVTLKGTGGTTLTNVKAGAVTATSTDAINGAQLHGTAQSVADSLGGGSKVDADGKVTNPTYSLADPADASKSVAYDNVGDALSNLDGRTVTNTQNITVINKQLGDSGLVDPVTGQSIAAVTYDRNADGTPNMGSVTLGGAGATAPVALKNVADGTDRHDAINLGQLQDAGLVAPVDPTNPGAGLASLAVTYGKNADGSANFDQVTLAGANGTTISNVKAGAVSANSTDAINGAQLHGVSQSVAKSLGGGAGVDADGNVTSPSYKVSDKTFDNVGDAIENISNSLVHGSIGLVQQDDTTRDITVAKDTDGTTVNFAGTAGNRVLTGVAAGAVSATSIDAVNGSQLHGTAQSVADVIGGGTTVDADGKLADTSIEVNGSKYKTVAEAVQAAAQYGATDSLAVRYDLNRDGTPNYGSVTLGGTGAAPVRLTNVADGASQYDAVNFGQLSELSDRIGGLDDRVGDLEQRPPGSGGPGNGGSGNDYFAGTDVGTGSTTPANAGAGTGNTAAGSGATIGTGANNATVIGSNAGASQSSGVAIGSGAKSAAEGATAIGSGSNASGNQSVAIGSGANASGSNSVALGAGSTAYGDDTVSVGSIDRTRTISNVSDGVNATDVATKGQLDRAMGGMQGQVNDLSRNAYSGIAAATALTMIPGVDPGKTISFGIGGATYKGYQAVAFGGEARITQNLKMKAGVGMSSGGNTVGVGASYQW